MPSFKERKAGENEDATRWKDTFVYERTDSELIPGTRVCLYMNVCVLVILIVISQITVLSGSCGEIQDLRASENCC